MLTRSFRRAAIKPFALLAALIPVAGGGVLAYNLFFARPGETAIQLLPQDVLFVMTLDTTPSPEQAATFKRIADAVEGEGLLPELDKALTEAMDKSPVFAELRPNLSRSFALAGFAGSQSESGSEPEMAILLAVKDPGKARGVLDKHGKKRSAGGLDRWTMENPEGEAALVGPYLVLGEKPAVVDRIHAVAQKKAPSLEKLADYQQARASLPRDANLMVFVSPAGMKAFGEQVKDAAGLAAPETRFFTLGVTVRDAGLEVTGQVPTAEKAGSPFAKLAEVAPIDPAVLGKLPAGAYGVFVMSQPGGLWEPVNAALRQAGAEGPAAEASPPAVELKPSPGADDAAGADEGPGEGAAEGQEGEGTPGEEEPGDEPGPGEPEEGPASESPVSEAIAEFESETGLSVEGELVPAFAGHLVVAVYPDAEKGTEGWDALLLVDDARGADPAAVARKLRLKLAEEGGPALVEEELNGRKIWVTAEPVEGKSACFAEAGKAVLLASSRGLLERALAGWDAAEAENLGAQPAFAGMQKALLPGAQVALMLDVRALLEAFRKPLEEGMAELEGTRLTFEDVAGVFGPAGKDGGAGFTFSAKYDGRVAGFQYFLPLDYERAVRLIGVGARKVAEEGAAARQPADGAEPRWEFTH